MKKYLVLMFLVLASCSTPVQLSSENEPDYYSATSTDGIFFTLDSNPELSANVENVPLHLGSGMFRKYDLDSQDQSMVLSYISYDNIIWQKEKGSRLPVNKNARIVDVKVIQQEDGTFKMFLEGEGL